MSIFVDYDGLKLLGKQFLDALPDSSLEEADAGFKCFAIAYLNCKLNTAQEEINAPLLMQVISNKFMQHELKLSK